MQSATLTFHAPNNNGSFLQAYALQQVLVREYGVQNKIVDFVSDRQAHQYSVLRKPESMGDMARNMISLLHYSDLKHRAERFDALRRKHLAMTERVTTEQEAINLASQYDIAICGSDQIWNESARDFSPAYFLPDFTKKKIAYAVSSGTNLSANPEYLNQYGKTFSAISVREPELKEHLKQQGVTDVDIVCDPTLLLVQSDYYPLFHRFPVVHGKYILLYTINYDDEVLRLTKELADIYNLPVYAPFTGYSSFKCAKYGIKVLYDVAPDRFLNLIYYATHVVSNSFHGIAFSIIFEKHFFRPIRVEYKDSAMSFVKDNRIDNLLDLLSLDSQRVFDHNGLKYSNMAIDYNQTGRMKTALRELQASSLAYLSRALEENI